MHRIFVYGTLKRGCVNHAYLGGQRWVGVARTEPRYRMFDLGGYPGMVEVADGLSIQGEVWDVDDDCFAQLDLLEDIEGGEYLRKQIHLKPPFEESRIQGYIYLRPTERAPEVGECWR